MANEIRLRSNNVQGTITDNPLTVGATTINSAGLADLPVVDATNHLILILDPLETGGPAEIVRVTAHTNLATSVTVVRGVEGSTARSHIFGMTWFHGPIASDINFTDVGTTSAIRPASPVNGQLIYETDTGRWSARTGGVWLPAPFNPPAVRVFHNAVQSLTNGVEVPLAFNSERFDTDTMHDNVTNNTRLTIRTPGLYQVNATVEFAAAADYTTQYSYVYVNNTTVIDIDIMSFADAADINRTCKISTVWKFAVNDFMELRALQTNSATAARNVVVNNARSPEFSAVWVGVG